MGEPYANPLTVKKGDVVWWCHVSEDKAPVMHRLVVTGGGEQRVMYEWTDEQWGPQRGSESRYRFERRVHSTEREAWQDALRRLAAIRDRANKTLESVRKGTDHAYDRLYALDHPEEA